MDRRIQTLGKTAMSEFQYYEFVAIDNPLNLATQKKLRAITSRATITASRLVNTYEWGDFKGDTHALVTQHFDGFLYYANWGTRHLMLRVPLTKLDAKLALQYCARRSAKSRDEPSGAAVSASKTHLVFSWWSEDDAANSEEIQTSSLGALTPIRNELMSGDHRALYLSWLLRKQVGEFGPKIKEPARPPDMKRLTGSQVAFAEFLRIDLSG
jgi:hypothetical protein